MANSFLNTALGKVQTFLNTIGADSVHAGAKTLVDTAGIPIAGEMRTTRWSPSAIYTTAVTATASVGKVIHQPVTLSGLTRGTDASGWLHGVRVLDKGYQRPDIAVMLLNAAVTFPGQGAAMSLSDTDALALFDRVEVFSSYYRDNTLNYIANLGSLAVPLFPLSGTDDVSVALVYLGTTAMTFGASDLVIDFITRH